MLSPTVTLPINNISFSSCLGVDLMMVPTVNTKLANAIILFLPTLSARILAINDDKAAVPMVELTMIPCHTVESWKYSLIDNNAPDMIPISYP